MQKNIKINVTSDGKMLSGFVKKYLNERHTFNTDVCQYTFGLVSDDEIKVEERTLETHRKNTEVRIKFPSTSHRQSS